MQTTTFTLKSGKKLLGLVFFFQTVLKLLLNSVFAVLVKLTSNDGLLDFSGYCQQPCSIDNCLATEREAMLEMLGQLLVCYDLEL